MRVSALTVHNKSSIQQSQRLFNLCYIHAYLTVRDIIIRQLPSETIPVVLDPTVKKTLVENRTKNPHPEYIWLENTTYLVTITSTFGGDIRGSNRQLQPEQRTNTNISWGNTELETPKNTVAKQQLRAKISDEDRDAEEHDSRTAQRWN
jgi:hypothetical protein